MSRTHSLELLKLVFQRTLAMYQPDIPAEKLELGTHLNEWNWGQGIALYGLQRTYHLLDADTQQAYFAFWRDWFPRYLDRTPPNAALNGALLTNVLWQSVHDPALPLSDEERAFYRAYCRERVEYYRQNAVRHASGVFGHTVAGIPESSKQVWSDNLFMLVLLLAQIATDKDETLFAEMVEQLRLHYQHLTDPATRLLYHGWQPNPNGTDRDLADNPGSHLNKALWGRGNGWAAMAGVEMVELNSHTNFATFHHPLLEITIPYFQVLLNYQREDGRWNTLIDKDWSYPETSATASIAYAFFKGAKMGILDQRFEQAGVKAIAALEEQISPSGEVLGCSGSTPILPTLEAYNEVPLIPVCTWGQGMGLLALGESSKS